MVSAPSWANLLGKIGSGNRPLTVHSALRYGLVTINAVWSRKDSLARVLLEYVIPLAAGLALLASVWQTARQVQRSIQRACKGEARKLLTRKGLVVSLASSLFAASCFYRSLFVADEGAGLCRAAPSVFNAPVSGRLVATVGETALVVQLCSYIAGTARRLQAEASTWTSFKRYTYLPLVMAESLSWSGVLTGITKFFCLEYMAWNFMALIWAWDSMVLLIVSRTWRDIAVHTALLFASLGLIVFNLALEIPHFFEAGKSDDGALESIFHCRQDTNSPIWTKRLPFFVAYFLVCSWCSVAISYHMYRNYGWKGDRYSTSNKAE